MWNLRCLPVLALLALVTVRMDTMMLATLPRQPTSPFIATDVVREIRVGSAKSSNGTSYGDTLKLEQQHIKLEQEEHLVGQTPTKAPTSEHFNIYNERMKLRLVEQQKQETAATPSRTITTLPNLLLVGAPKAGTSALANWFFQNGVCGGTAVEGEPDWFAKEMHFFDNPIRYIQGTNFYQDRYKDCYDQKKRFVMDATPSTMMYPQRVYETYQNHTRAIQNLKIILTLREPIARELSSYNHLLSSWELAPDPTAWYFNVAHPNGTVKTFEQFVETDTLPKLDQSMSHYSSILKRWFHLFHPRQILILHYEDEIKHSSQAKQYISKFLGNALPLNTKGPFPTFNTRDGSTKVRTIPCRVVERLQKVYEPWNQELYQLLRLGGPYQSFPRRSFPSFPPPDCVLEEDTTAG